MVASQRGLREWFVQRVTAIVMGLYTLFVLGFFLVHPGLSYLEWKSLYVQPWFKIASLIVFVSVLWHAWIGLWTVLTDYVKPFWMRLLLEIAIALLLIAYGIWSVLTLFQF